MTEEQCRSLATKRFDDYVRKTKSEGKFKPTPQTPTWEKERALMIQFRIDTCLKEGFWEDEIDSQAAALYAEAQAAGKPYALCGTAGCAAAASGIPEALCRSVSTIRTDSYTKRKGLKITAQERTDSIEDSTQSCLKNNAIWFNDLPSAQP